MLEHFQSLIVQFHEHEIASNVNIYIVMVTMVVGPIQIHPNEDIKVFNRHQVIDHLNTLLLSMAKTISLERLRGMMKQL